MPIGTEYALIRVVMSMLENVRTVSTSSTASTAVSKVSFRDAGHLPTVVGSSFHSAAQRRWVGSWLGEGGLAR